MSNKSCLFVFFTDPVNELESVSKKMKNRMKK